MAVTFFGPAFQQIRLASGLVTLLTRSYNPPVQAPGFGLFRFRSPLLSESRLIYFPPGTEMVHFPGLARTRLWIQRAVGRFYRLGFPHSEIPGSKPACGYPGLIAACHVLLRLLAPRHPPYALSSLTIKLTQRASICSDQGPARTSHAESCKLRRLALAGCVHSPSPNRGSGPMLTTHVQVRLSTLRYFEQKFAVIHGNETLRYSTAARHRDASFLQLSKIVSRFHLLSGSPLPAERSLGLEPMLRVPIKNPASSAGHVRLRLGVAV